MPSFEIQVRTDEPIRTAQAMHRAQMPTIDWAGSGFVRTPGGDWTIGEEFVVFVAAGDLVEALDRLESVDANFEIVAGSEPLPS